MIGIVEQLIQGRDGKARRVLVRYQNASEEQSQLSDRGIRELVKIFDVEEYVLQDDLAELLRRLDAQKEKDDIGPQAQVVRSNVQYNDNPPNMSSISGTWLQLPVPILPSTAEETHNGDQEVISENKEPAVDEIGGWCQVPSKTVHASNPSKNPSHSIPPVRSPHFYPALVKKLADTLPAADNTMSVELAKSFCLAATLQQSTQDQDWDASDLQGLMELLNCTDMDLS